MLITEKAARKRSLWRAAVGLPIVIVAAFFGGWTSMVVSAAGFVLVLQAHRWWGYAKALRESEREYAAVDGVMVTIVGSIPPKDQQAIYEALSERFGRVTRMPPEAES